MVRAIVSRLILSCVLLLCACALFTSKAAAFAADTTSVSVAAVADTTTGTSCDALGAGKSCLGQKVTITATVTDQTTAASCPTGRVDFFDGGVLIGSALLSSTTSPACGTPANKPMTAPFATGVLSIGGSTHNITATYVSDNTGAFASQATSNTVTWDVQARPTTTTVAPPGGGIVVATTGNINVSVQDVGPIPNGRTPGSFLAAGCSPQPCTPLKLTTARYGFGGADLPWGSVLVAGGTNIGGTAEASAEILSTSSTAAGPLNTARTFLTLTALPDGSVLAVGGSSDQCLSAAQLATATPNTNGVLDTAEIYDPYANTFVAITGGATSKLNTARCGHTATALSNGDVLIAGGYDKNGNALTSTELFKFSTQKFGAATPANLGTARAGHIAVTLQNGTILIAGGDGSNDAEIIDSGAGTTTPSSGNMAVKRSFFAATTMPDGDVVLAGGIDAATGKATSSAELYDASADTFTAISSTLTTPRAYFGSVTLVSDATVGYAGGQDDTGAVLGSVEDYAPAYDPRPGASLTSADGSDDVGASGTTTSTCTFTLSSTGISSCNISLKPGHVNTGTHALTGSYTATTNHAASTDNTHLLTVTATPLTITAKDQLHGYGSTHAFSVLDCTNAGADCTATGLINGDTVTVSYASTANTVTSGVGVYANNIIPSAATISPGTDQSDYSFTYVNGTMTVTNAALTVTANDDSKNYGQTKTYGAGSTAFISSGLQNGETIGSVTITDTNSGGVATAAANGTYHLTPSAATGGTFNPGNYTITYKAGTLTVNPVPLTVTAKDQTKVYGTTFTFTGAEFTSSGLLNLDTVTSVTLTSPGAAATATVTSPGPTYAIVPSAAVGSGLGNYTITYVNGTMMLSPAAAITVTAKNQGKVYGQTFTFNGNEFTTAGLLNSDSVTSVTLASAGAAGTATFIAPGPSYAITASAAVGNGLGNYLGVNYVDGTMTLSPASLAVTAKNLAKTYGDALSFVGTEFTTGGLVNSDSVASVTLASAGNAATATFVSPGPAYVITPSAAVGSGLGNYLITYNNGTLILNARPLMITANNGSKIYGTAPSFAGTLGTALGQVAVANIANTDTVTSVSLASTGQGANANVITGGYPIVPTNPQGTGLANYSPVFTPGTLLVTPATPAMRAEQVATKIDAESGGMVITLKAFLYNSNAPGGAQGTGVGIPTQTVDIFDGTTKLNTSPIALVPNTTSGPCSSTNQNCGSEASFVTAPIQIGPATLHKINVVYSGDTNFGAASVQVAALTGAPANTFAAANIPPSTSTSVSLTLANPEPLLSGQSYVLKCNVFSATTGVQQTAALCTTSSGTGAVTLPGNISIAVATTNVSTTGEQRLRGIYDLSFTVPAIVLVGVGFPVGLKRRVKGRTPLVWLGITVALVLCLVAVGCGGNGFANPTNVPVATSGSAQAGQYTIIVTATDTTNNNSFDVAAVPFTISQ